MARSYFQDFNLDDGRKVTVEYGYEDGGTCPCILDAWIEPANWAAEAVNVKLTGAEDERMCAWIMEHRYWSDH
jgi:hypothetical protein